MGLLSRYNSDIDCRCNWTLVSRQIRRVTRATLFMFVDRHGVVAVSPFDLTLVDEVTNASVYRIYPIDRIDGRFRLSRSA